MSSYLVDTDVFIWYLRKNKKARELFHKIDFSISSVTYMELIQGMRNKEELNLLNKMIREWKIDIILVDENINSKAIFYMQEYFLSHSMQLADSLIAATCSINGLTLISGNDKHYKMLNIDLIVFRPN